MNDLTSFRNALAVTTHDTNPNQALAIYVGGAGNITCRPRGNTADVLFTAVPVGSILYVEVTHIRATGTTATALVALN